MNHANNEFESGWIACMNFKPYDEAQSEEWKDGYKEAEIEAAASEWESME